MTGMHLAQTAAYALLVLALITGAVAAYQLRVFENYYHATALLLGALLVNLARRMLAPVDERDVLLLVSDRLLFFAWPLGVLALLCTAFERHAILQWAIAPLTAFFVGMLVVGAEHFDETLLCKIEQLVAGATGVFAVTLILLREQHAAFLTPLEMAAFFCGAAEGVIALVGFLVPGTWWPAICVYCVLYLALALLHLRVLWSLRRPTSLDLQRT
jgi:hypothetical protein